MKRLLLIVCFVLGCLCCNAQWQSSYRKRSAPKYDPSYQTTVIDGITYMVENYDGSTYCVHAIDTVKKQSHVDIPSSVIIDGNTYPVKKIVFKYENHKSIRLPSTITWVYIISSKMKYPSEYPQWYYDKSDRKIDNSNREPLFIEATGEKPPFIDEPIPMYWGSIKRLVSNPENVVLIVPRQYVETYKKSEQWEGAQVFSSKEEYYSYRKFYLDSCQKAKELKERQLQNGTWWDDGVTYIDEDRSVEINDWRFEIDGEGGLYYAMNYENLKKDKEIVSICFLFKVLTNDSDINGHKYVYCSFRPTGSSSSDEKKEDWLCPPTPQDNVRIEYNETPDWNVSDVSTEKVMGVQITKAIIYYRHSTQHLSGFPKNFKVRHSNANSAK